MPFARAQTQAVCCVLSSVVGEWGHGGVSELLFEHAFRQCECTCCPCSYFDAQRILSSPQVMWGVGCGTRSMPPECVSTFGTRAGWLSVAAESLMHQLFLPCATPAACTSSPPFLPCAPACSLCGCVPVRSRLMPSPEAFSPWQAVA